MRIPISKPYRAFPELDPYDDEACKAYMRRARAKGRWLRLCVGLLAAGMGLGVSSVLIALIGFVAKADAFQGLDLLVGVIVIGSFFFAALTPYLCAAIASDVMIQRQLRRRLDTAECGGCGYSLIGQRPLPDPDGRGDFVRCPECGMTSPVGRGGIPRENLMHGGGGGGGDDATPGAVWDDVDAHDAAVGGQHPLLRRYPALHQVGPERVDEAVAAVADEREALRRRAVLVGFAVFALLLTAVVWLSSASPIAPRYVWRGSVGLEFSVVGSALVAFVPAWAAGAWTKRLIRAVGTQRAVESVIGEMASASAGGPRAAVSDA